MATGKESINPFYGSSPLPGDLTMDHRAKMALYQHEAAERRRLELAEQVSELRTPAERIRIWEKLHMLPLPLEATHPLLSIIAKGTALTLQQLHLEQKQRSSTAKPT